MDTKKKIFIAIFLFTFLIRLVGINKLTIYPDEITWMVKGKEALYALKDHNLDYFKYGWWNSTKDSYAIGWPIVILGGLSHILIAGTGKFSFHLVSDILSVRLPEIVISSLIPSLLFYYSSAFVSLEVALFAALALSISPISMAIDRWFIHDSFLSLFYLLSLGSFLKSYQKNQLSIFPGLWLSLGALTKPLGIVPAIGWLIILIADINNKFTRKLFTTNVISAFIFIQILWPQSWIEPVVSYPKYLLRQLILVNSGDPIPNYFFGLSNNSPHWTYYLYELLIRTPELILISAVIGLSLLLKRLKDKYVLYLVIPNAICFYLLSSSSVKGGIRYLLFLLPLIYLLSAWIIVSFLKKIKANKKFIYLLILCHLMMISISFYPDYYLYYNSLSGGGENEKKYILVSLCYGNKSSLEYLDKNNLHGPVFIFGCQDSGYYHTSRRLTKVFKDAKYIVIESSYEQQHPDNPSLKTALTYKKIAKVFQKEIQTSTIYENPFYDQLILPLVQKAN